MATLDELKIGLILSVVFHAALAVMFAVGLPLFERDFATPRHAIPVEVVDIDDVTRVKAPEPEPKREQPKTSPTPARNVTRPQNVDAVPMPDAKPRLDQSELDRKQIVAQVTPETKPRPPSQFDAGKIAALIDKSIKETTPETPPDREKQLEEAVEQAQVGSLDVRRMTATIEDYIKQKMLACWSVPVGAQGVEEMQITIRITLNPDGFLVGAPDIAERGRLFRPGNEFYRAFAESAARAVRRCEPYDKLPKQYYNRWKELELNFNTRDMLG